MLALRPLFTLALCALALGLQSLPQPIHETLYFDYSRAVSSPAGGLGLITAHWIHADWSHLAWNVASLGVLGAILESYSRRALLAAIAAGTFAVDFLLLSPLAGIEQYCGMSGLLNTLLGSVLFFSWQRTRSSLVGITLLLYLGKITIELATQHSLFTSISWPPYAPAHVAGILATPLALWLAHQVSSTQELQLRETAL